MANSTAPAGYDGLHVLIAGGGVAALEAAFALRALAGDLVDLEILAPEPRFLYRPQAVIEPFGGIRAQMFELAELADSLGAQLTLDELASVAPQSHVARTRRGATIPYDALLIACGALPRPVLDGTLTFRGPADTDQIAAIAQRAARGQVERVTFAIPSRRTWLLPPYELAFGLRTVAATPITIATVESVPGAVLGRSGSEELERLLASFDIGVEMCAEVGRDELPGVVIASPELRAERIYGIPADDDGFISTNRGGAVQGLEDVYAAGDITNDAVKHGSLAAGQADATAAAIAALAGADVPQAPFSPILRARLACGEESLYVRRDLYDPFDSGTVSHDPLWSPAAKIFARHLSPTLAAIGRRHQRSLLGVS
jgi:sulfide:quinone oxidoreductase